MNEVSSSNFDGFYFLPAESDEDMQLAFFKVKDGVLGEPVKTNSIGDMFHVAFFRKGEDGLPQFDEEFEAVFSDPKVYVRNLLGANIYGTFLRKTEKSGEFWKEYLDDAKSKCSMSKVKTFVESFLSLKNER